MSNVMPLHPNRVTQQEQARQWLQELIGCAIEYGAQSVEDLDKQEWRQLTAAAIRAADPAEAWHFIGMAPDSGTYPELVAEALDSRGPSAEERLVRALVSGAVQHARHIIEEEFRQGLERERR